MDYSFGMSAITRFMGADHDRLDRLFLEFQGAKHRDPERARELFSEFRSGLLRHIGWEEELLFPLFEERTGMRGGGPTAVMRMEHRQIQQFLERVQAALSSGAPTGDLEEGLLALLKGHNEKEEAVLYPWVDRVLGEDGAGEMVRKMEASGR